MKDKGCWAHFFSWCRWVLLGSSSGRLARLTAWCNSSQGSTPGHKMTSIKALVIHQSLKALWGKVIFPAPLHPEKTAQSLFWRGFFPDSDVAFKSLDVCTQQINSWSSGRTKWFYGLKFETHWIQASALPLSELALSSTHRAALFFVGEGGRTALHINWQPTAVDLFPALYSFQDSKQGGWKASKCQSRLG